jgi:Ca-activated chloride channel homolog
MIAPLKTRKPTASANLKVETTMVLVPITVTDAKDHPVTDLTPNAFRVFEDNIEQKVVSFQQEDGPVSVGFIFDASSSMKKRMEKSVGAIEQFLKTTMPHDEFFLIRFADSPKMVTGFTDNPDDILSELSFVQPQGWTALNDAIVLGIHKMHAAKNTRRALFVLTDGSDNNSRYTDNELRNLVRESDVRIYSIGLYERPEFLEKLGMDSGGKAYWAHKLDDLPATVERLSRDFRNQYVLGYAPQDPHNDGKFRSVRIQILKTIEGMPLNVFWRHGYFSLPD